MRAEGGRRIVYLSSLPILCLGSLGVAAAQNVPLLLLFRVIQGFGSSAGLSVGTAVIADIYRLEQRGTAMGIFFAVRRFSFLFRLFLYIVL